MPGQGADLGIKTYPSLAMVIETLKGIDKYSREGGTPGLGKMTPSLVVISASIVGVVLKENRTGPNRLVFKIGVQIIPQIQKLKWGIAANKDTTLTSKKSLTDAELDTLLKAISLPWIDRRKKHCALPGVVEKARAKEGWTTSNGNMLADSYHSYLHNCSREGKADVSETGNNTPSTTGSNYFGSFPREAKITFEGLVMEALPNGMFRVRLENDTIILGYISGKIRSSSIRILMGDRVKIEPILDLAYKPIILSLVLPTSFGSLERKLQTAPLAEADLEADLRVNEIERLISPFMLKSDDFDLSGCRLG
uniref:Translation initiation factor IF-1 family protein n=1 Tax=Oryza sativa subsp. japonica TaxID=39947 RepID=Q2QPM5_ORYSJ|nr:translation initiation factor IF-1 family protein [Oryza sativa Japonica Group]